MWYATVTFNRETFCEQCRERIARRASDWTVVDAAGNLVESSLLGEDGNRADYLLTCGKCGHAFEVHSPEDVQQYKFPEGSELPSRYVTKMDD